MTVVVAHFEAPERVGYFVGVFVGAAEAGCGHIVDLSVTALKPTAPRVGC
jgi:hypothetical protein